MKILVLCSGGDSPGMNYCMYSLLKMGRRHTFYGAIAGFKGLIESNFVKLELKTFSRYKDIAGSIIKSSRCPEFKTKKGVKSAVKNIRENNFDCVIVLGGDGSYRGCVELSQNDINVIFIPATIDRDLPYPTYSIGFLSAVFACSEYILQVMNSFDSFDRTGVFEVMGRDNSSICKMVSEIVNADLCITSENFNNIEYDKLDKTNKSQIVVLQENLLNIENLCENLEEHLQTEVKGCVIGYLQRGIDPVANEKKLCSIFAKLAIKSINKKMFNRAMSLNENLAQTIDI